jgi:hypothetical protein
MTQEIWKRLPNETVKAYNAFVKYRTLLIDGEGLGKRSLENTMKLLNLKSMTGVEGWSRKNNWVERAAAWDEKRRTDIIQIQDVDAVVYRQEVTDRLMLKLVALNKVVDAEIKAALEQQSIGERITAVEIKRLVEATTMLDNLARRAANMPTTFRSEAVQDQSDTTEYMLGELDE